MERLMFKGFLSVCAEAYKARKYDVMNFLTFITCMYPAALESCVILLMIVLVSLKSLKDTPF